MLALEFAAVLVAAWWIRSGRRTSGRVWLTGGLAVAVFLASGAARAGPPRWLTVTFLSVGWGDSALVRSPGGASILIDGGPDAELVSTDLARLGVTRLDAIV